MTFNKRNKNRSKIIFIPFFQPIYFYNRRKIIGYEILLREVDLLSNKINHPLNINKSFLTNKTYFIDLKRKYYRKILTKTLFKKELFFLNLNFKILDNISFYNFFLRELKKRKNKNLVFEILENNKTFSNKEMEFISFVKEIGYKIAIDDVGSGYSNFERVKNLCEYIEFIKIDGKIIKNLKNKKNQKFLLNILDFSKRENKKVILEHIENDRVLHDIKSFLKKNNFQNNNILLQGYYLGYPLPL